MPNTTPRRTLRERQQQRIREDLVSATLELIADEGMEQTTVERIVEAGGVSRATLYAHFPGGRDELLRAAYAGAGTQLLAAAEQAAVRAGGWHDRLLAYARAMIEFSGSPQLGHFYSVSGPHLLGFRAERGVGSQGFFEVFRDELARAIAAGEVVAHADPEALATLLVSSLRDAGIEASRTPQRAEALIASVGLLLDGIRADRHHQGAS